MELFGKSWWGKMLIAIHGLAKFGIVDACKPFKIEDFEGSSHSEAKPHQNLCGNAESWWVRTKVGGAAAPPTVWETPPVTYRTFSNESGIRYL